MSSLPNQYNKTRIAPTPSGFLHLGNVLSFSITAALARKSGAKILLRIDDLDQPRVNKQYVQDIFDTLNFLEIPWDEGPKDVKEFETDYSQQHRMPIYREAIDQLIDHKFVFACTCSRKQLNEDQSCNCIKREISPAEKNASLRLITDNTTELEIKNYGGQTIRTVLPVEMHNFVVRRKDGLPAYQLTSVIDDLFYGVDLVVRGEDLWPSTLAQHQLASALGQNDFCNITFYHHGLLKETSGKKLSKSADATSVRYLRESGKTPAAIYKLIGDMLGSNETINNWQQLAGILIHRRIN
jgi:glutamyl/glutaminyl-tRNA synthetase